MDTDNAALALVALRRMCRSGEAREIREKSGLSQAEMAAGIPASRAAVSAWELGTRIPHGEAAERYLALLLTLADDSPTTDRREPVGAAR